jgi:hypothetical protein
MPTAGYSGTPLLKKLGITPIMKVQLINVPEQYFLWLQTDVSSQLITSKETPDFIHVFVTSIQQFETVMQKLKPVYKANPQIIIWVSWYKKSSGIVTDVTEDAIRNYALQNALVDVKVCAVNEQWSGLKLVVPRKYRMKNEE